MRVDDVPRALRQQLGPEATDGLLGVLDRARREAAEDMMRRSAESFECRLTAELAGLRTDFRDALARHHADFREALAIQRAEFRELIATQGSDVRSEFAAQKAELREAIGAQGAALQVEIATSRADVLRWLFIFWTGQIVALAALLRVLL